MESIGSAPPRTVIGDPSQADGLGQNCWVPSASSGHCAGRRMTPSGTTPSRTSRHRAIRSLRAKATIMVLRVPRAFSVRARNHCAKALSFWNMRNRHAILAALLPALVGRASEARITRYGASIAQVSRQHLVHQHVGRLDANAHHTRQQAHHGMRSLAGFMLEVIQACALDLPDLIAHEPSAFHVAM